MLRLAGGTFPVPSGCSKTAPRECSDGFILRFLSSGWPGVLVRLWAAAPKPPPGMLNLRIARGIPSELQFRWAQIYQNQAFGSRHRIKMNPNLLEPRVWLEASLQSDPESIRTERLARGIPLK